MEKLIPITNKLQDIFNAIGTQKYDLNLPQIVVVGSQSSGKSSVLESIVGKDFLPRGKGVCTRRPLILQLRAIKDEEDDYGMFLLSDQKIKNFSEIREEIKKRTEKETGNNKGISAKPINLKLFSKNFIDLTLIDLPGITKVAVGDQPGDIEKKLRAIVREYASKPDSFILAVIPANADIATSDALQIAKELDPQSKRTMGVLTKVDLMDKGQNALDILNGKIFPLQNGYIAIKNRSQIEISQGVSVKKGLENERKFFTSSSCYSKLSHRTGIDYLTKRLNIILVERIKKALPKLKFHIRSIINEVERELEQYGNGHEGNLSSQSEILLSSISKFSSCFSNAIDGKEKSLITIKELYGGARISSIFHSIFSRNVLELDPFDHLTDEDIFTAIQNATGTRPSLFVPEMSFETLSKRQIMRLVQPVVECVELVFKELLRVSRNCFTPEIQRYPKLTDRISDCVNDILVVNKQPALKMVHCLIDIEISYINTNHPDFIGGSSAVPSALQKIKKQNEKSQKHSGTKELSVSPPNARNNTDEENRLQNQSERKKIEIEIIKSLIYSYFKIVQKNILDSVPKAIMHFLVNRSKEELQSKLVSELYKEELFESLLEESGEIASERTRCIELLSILRKALEIIETVREFRSEPRDN